MKWGRVFLIVLGSSLLTGMAAELLLVLLLPFPDPFAAEKQVNQYVPSAHQSDLSLEIHIEPGLPGVATVHPGRVNRFTTNGHGFRGPELVVPKPDSELRVFLVGGSSTESLALDDSESLERVLSERLVPRAGRRYAVYNAGKSGDKSSDHLSMIGQRLIHLEPDIIVVFAGVNDLTAAIFDYDYLHWKPIDFNLRKLLRLTASELQLMRRSYVALRWLRTPGERELQETIALDTNNRERAELQQRSLQADGPPRVDLAPYRRNLESIVGVVQAAGARTVMMTQATTWNGSVDEGARDWHWMRLRGGRVYGEVEMDRALERYNDVMRQISAANPDVRLADLSSTLPKSLDYIYDDVHFNTRGARRAAALLAELIDR